MEFSPQLSRRFLFTSFWNSHPNPNRWILSKSHPFQSISSGLGSVPKALEQVQISVKSGKVFDDDDEEGEKNLQP
ncbi:hypothetical protein L1987_02267 [Smallanthus sonchifolius]|uniref:Uncharacterized protein n=1 Tax=Smallanthus sonchifolius TaxID=185202 RepID=A0ACB9K7J4_9ASTR|nr:hypothetical protein L1987_02267 [Smallanthus sonchifolius]